MLWDIPEVGRVIKHDRNNVGSAQMLFKFQVAVIESQELCFGLLSLVSLYVIWFLRRSRQKPLCFPGILKTFLFNFSHFISIKKFF